MAEPLEQINPHEPVGDTSLDSNNATMKSPVTSFMTDVPSETNNDMTWRGGEHFFEGKLPMRIANKFTLTTIRYARSILLFLRSKRRCSRMSNLQSMLSFPMHVSASRSQSGSRRLVLPSLCGQKLAYASQCSPNTSYTYR